MNIQRFILICLSLSLTACYTFNPAKSSTSLDKLKTFSVGIIVDEAGGPAFLSNKVTERIRSYFQQNTRLILIKNNADLTIEGRVTAYTTSPNNVGSDNIATSNRLTISLSLNCENTADPAQSFQNKNFDKFDIYGSNQSLPAVEGNLTTNIIDLLVVDIFNTVFTW
jgi:hypothetical protein